MVGNFKIVLFTRMAAAIALFGCSASPVYEKGSSAAGSSSEVAERNIYYDYYGGGYDVTDDYEADDWFYDYYYKDNYRYSRDLDYQYIDTNEVEEYPWEESGLFEDEAEEGGACDTCRH